MAAKKRARKSRKSTSSKKSGHKKTAKKRTTRKSAARHTPKLTKAELKAYRAKKAALKRETYAKARARARK